MKENIIKIKKKTKTKQTKKNNNKEKFASTKIDEPLTSKKKIS